MFTISTDISVLKFPMYMKRTFNTNYKHLLEYWEFYTTILKVLWTRNFQEYKYIKHWISPSFHMDAKIGIL